MNAPARIDPAAQIAVELRVLHGPQAGSRLTLIPHETHLLGSGDACTIMLAGAQIQGEHARLTVRADHWVVEPVQGGVATLDGLACGPDRPLAFGAVVQLGLVKLTAEREDAAWPQDEALEPPARPEPTNEEPVPDKEVDEAAAALAAEAAARCKAEAAAREAVRAASRRRTKAAALVACMAGSAIALTAYAGWQMMAPPPETPMENVATSSPRQEPTPPRPTPHEVLQAWFQPLSRLGRLSLEGQGDGPWRVLGYVPTNSDRDRLSRAAQSQPWPVSVDVVSEAERQMRVRRFLETQVSPALDARLTGTQDGALQIRVLAATQADADRLTKQLRENHTAFEPFAFEVLLPRDIRQRFLDGLKAAGLGQRFEVLQSEPVLTLSALLAHSEVKQWEHYFSQFTADHGSVLAISATVRTERDSVESRIRAVVAGRYPYVITTSGERIAPGGQIDGKVLAAIGAQEVLFADGLRVRLQP